MASNYGVIAFINPSRLESVTQPALIKFETEYAAYKEKCADVNRTKADGDKIPIATIRDCMEGSSVHALCIMGDISGASTVEDVSPEMVQSWFDSALAEASRDLSERIRSALSTVHFKPCKEDPSGAVVMFVIDVIKSLDQNNASEILNDADKAKFLIDRMEAKLEPPLLRERIRMKRTLWTKAEKGDIKRFRKEASALAVDVAQSEVARSRINLPAKRTRPSRQDRDDYTERNSKRKRPNNPGNSVSDRLAKNTPPSEKKSSGPKQITCLNTECGGNHMVKECPNSSPELRKKLLNEYFKARKSAKVLTIRERRAAENVTTGRYEVAIEDKVRAAALGDSGADCSAIPRRLFDRIIEEVPSVASTIKDFENPVPLEGAFGTGAQCTSSKSITLSITLFLAGSNIPVRLRGVQFVVVDENMDEVLLGRPLLNAIGFNLDEHLESIRAHVHGKDIKDIDLKAVKLGRAQYSGLSYQSVDDDPIALPECIAAGIGTDSEESIQSAFASIIESAKTQGISDKGAHTLSLLLKEYRTVFRIKLGPDPPASVPPLVITPIPNARPYRSTQRRYAPQQRDFIIQTIRELESVGAIYKNPSARWARPALAVPKPGSTKLRFIVDLRCPNARTIPIQSSMPHLESKLQDISGSQCFANIDLAHGYWQVPLSKESQEFMSIQTPIGVYSSRRLLQGGSDSGNHFQAVLQEKFDGRVDNMLQWLDDFLFFAKSEEELLSNFGNFFKVCAEVGIKIHAEKSNLFARSVQFCGRFISAEGIQYSPRHPESLLQMKKPSTAAELQQLICATNWMRNSIPAYAELIAPLHHLLESAYAKAGKRTKQAVRRISIASS